MPYRIFEDSRGVEWQVWDIVPRLAERRAADGDRRVESDAIEFTDRRGEERRLTTTHRATLRGSYALGWLAFDNGREKRRLTPIPKDWITCNAERLEQYGREAIKVPSSRDDGFAFRGQGDEFAEAG